MVPPFLQQLSILFCILRGIPMKKYTYGFVFAFCVFAAATSLTAGSLPDALTRSIDSVFSEFSHPGTPGCALGIYRNGEIVYAKGYGTADIEHRIPVTPQTRFDIGSTAKQFTAACLLLLEQQGKLSLDDDIRQYLPEIPDYGRRITIRHLLNHTSGLRDYIGLMVVSGFTIDDVTTPEDAMRMITQQQATDFEPGSEFRYSNTGYFLASQIVERASGQSLRAFAQQHIFGPLGMKHTSYIDDHTELIPDRAIGYSSAPDGFHRDVSYWEQNGDGGVFTTVEDLLLWDNNFYRPTVGGEKLTAGLLRRGMLSNGDTLDYATGLMHGSFRGLPIVSHGGAWGGYRAQFLRVPSERFSVVVLFNSGDVNPDKFARAVTALVLADKLEAPVRKKQEKPAAAAVAINPDIFEAYEGNYELEVQPGFILSFSSEDGRYYTQATGQGRLEMIPMSDSTFAISGVDAAIVFHRETDGTVQRLTLQQHGEHTARRVRNTPPPVEDPTLYTGRYYSPELNIVYTVSVEDGKLTVRHPRYGKAELISSPAKGVFSSNSEYLGSAGFETDASGHANAMLVSVGPIRNMRFERQD